VKQVGFKPRIKSEGIMDDEWGQQKPLQIFPLSCSFSFNMHCYSDHACGSVQYHQ